MSRVSINIVTWNSMKYLPALMASLAEQTFQDFSVLVIDNASTDGTIEFLRERYPTVTVVRNFRNLGFAAAHNQGMKYALAAWGEVTVEDRYILVTNPDTILTQTFLETLVSLAAGAREVASFGGKLLKVSHAGEEDLEEEMRSTIIDSTGLVVGKNRRMVDRGAGEEDVGQYDESGEVFGISGALALYRASALMAVSIGGEYFDEDFFAYKEDGDLASRLQLAGFSSRYVPGAVAYHYRTAFGRERASLLEFFSNRKNRSPFTNYLSYRNHLFLLVKNECWSNGIRHFPQIFCYECAKFFSLLFSEPRTIAAWFDFWRTLPRMLEKRAEVMGRRRTSPREMRKWFV